MFERTVQPVLDVKDKPKPAQWAFLSLQHLFAMFGSTVLVPFLTHLPISAALLASGIGTLLYILITKRKFLPRIEFCLYYTYHYRVKYT